MTVYLNSKKIGPLHELFVLSNFNKKEKKVIMNNKASGLVKFLLPYFE